MTFPDLPEGKTHYENDGCGEPAHNSAPPRDALYVDSRTPEERTAQVEIQRNVVTTTTAVCTCTSDTLHDPDCGAYANIDPRDHTVQTHGMVAPTGEWEDGLMFEVMEDYLMCAEMRHHAKDQVAHMEEMRGHWEKLKSFITRLLLSQKEQHSGPNPSECKKCRSEMVTDPVLQSKDERRNDRPLAPTSQKEQHEKQLQAVREETAEIGCVIANEVKQGYFTAAIEIERNRILAALPEAVPDKGCANIGVSEWDSTSNIERVHVESFNRAIGVVRAIIDEN